MSIRTSNSCKICFLVHLLVPKSYDLETWHATSGTQALQIYINYDLGLTMTYFRTRSNLVAYMFEWEQANSENLCPPPRFFLKNAESSENVKFIGAVTLTR